MWISRSPIGVGREKKKEWWIYLKQFQTTATGCTAYSVCFQCSYSPVLPPSPAWSPSPPCCSCSTPFSPSSRRNPVPSAAFSFWLPCVHHKRCSGFTNSYSSIWTSELWWTMSFTTCYNTLLSYCLTYVSWIDLFQTLVQPSRMSGTAQCTVPSLESGGGILPPAVSPSSLRRKMAFWTWLSGSLVFPGWLAI